MAFMGPDNPPRYMGSLFTDSDRIIGIETLEGLIVAKEGDWVIKGVIGEFYPCKPDVFKATYESVWTFSPQQDLIVPCLPKEFKCCCNCIGDDCGDKHYNHKDSKFRCSDWTERPDYRNVDKN